MSDDNGQGNDPKTPSGDQPYKSFSSQDEFTTFQSKTFSSGYNDMKSKALAKLGDVLGEEVTDFDEALDKVKSFKSKAAEGISDPTATDEYKALQNTVNQYKQKLTQAQETAQAIQNQYKIDSTFSEATNTLKEASKFKIPESDVKDLFLAKHKVEFKDGREVVRKGDELLIDDSGSPKSLKKAFIDFSKSYTEPATDGAGGGSGDGGGVKPSYEEYKKLVKNKKYNESKKLYDQAMAAGGWKERDILK